jgi:hypothetical protein
VPYENGSKAYCQVGRHHRLRFAVASVVCATSFGEFLTAHHHRARAQFLNLPQFIISQQSAFRDEALGCVCYSRLGAAAVEKKRKCRGGQTGRSRERSLLHGEPRVRIHLPPAERPSLAGIPFRRSRNPALRAVWAAGLAPGSAETRRVVSISRQPAAVSLSGYIPVPQCPDGVGESATPVPTESGLRQA